MIAVPRWQWGRPGGGWKIDFSEQHPRDGQPEHSWPGAGVSVSRRNVGCPPGLSLWTAVTINTPANFTVSPVSPGHSGQWRSSVLESRSMGRGVGEPPRTGSLYPRESYVCFFIFLVELAAVTSLLLRQYTKKKFVCRLRINWGLKSFPRLVYKWFELHNLDIMLGLPSGSFFLCLKSTKTKVWPHFSFSQLSLSILLILN